MKKALILLFVLIMCFCSGCQNTDTSSAVVTLNQTELELAVGDSFKLELLGAREPEWSSSDESVVRVYYGAVTGVSEGEATVTAEADGKSYSCRVTVKAGDNKGGSVPIADPVEPIPEVSQETESKTESVPEKEQSSSSNDDAARKTQQAADKLMMEGTHKKIDEEYDKLIADFSAECDELIWELELNVESKKREIERLNSEAPNKGTLIYGEQLSELEAELSNAKKIKQNGIDTYNRKRAEDKENWRDRILVID